MNVGDPHQHQSGHYVYTFQTFDLPSVNIEHATYYLIILITYEHKTNSEYYTFPQGRPIPSHLPPRGLSGL